MFRRIRVDAASLSLPAPGSPPPPDAPRDTTGRGTPQDKVLHRTRYRTEVKPLDGPPDTSPDKSLPEIGKFRFSSGRRTETADLRLLAIRGTPGGRAAHQGASSW